jgi:hypothetical protein
VTTPKQLVEIEFTARITIAGLARAVETCEQLANRTRFRPLRAFESQELVRLLGTVILEAQQLVTQLTEAPATVADTDTHTEP